GVSRKNAAYVTEWTAPKTIQETFSRWRFFHHKLHLTITETTIDHDVYLEHYTSEQSGGSGDYSYSISFVVAKDIVVRVVSPNANTTPGVSPATPTASGKKHTVKSGESLWMIAQKYMGSASNYPALYDMNKGIIDAKNAKVKVSKYTIYAGQVLTIP
ncbi:MAG: LysM peptidoglycan-binding domain-containing protein, partial [Evtepia sp.]